MQDKEIMQTGLFLYLIRYDYKNYYKLIEDITITKDRYIFSKELELTPIEDMGDYIISDTKLTYPVEEFLSLCGEN